MDVDFLIICVQMQKKETQTTYFASLYLMFSAFYDSAGVEESNYAKYIKSE